MTKQFIINSDDYGRTPDISRGIREAHLQGIVTSTTCMMNMPTIDDDIVTAMEETPGLKMGVHLVLTAKKPVLPPERVPSLTDPKGNFLKYDPFIANLPNIKVEEAKAEWRAQINAFARVSGRRPTHLDSHHHSSFFSADLFQGMLELASEFDCAIRYPFTDVTREIEETSKQAPNLMREFNPRHPDTFIVHFYDDGATKEALLDIIKDIADGTHELMCHPGHVDEAFAEESVYNFQRERELKILTDPEIREAIEANHIDLISFADL